MILNGIFIEFLHLVMGYIGHWLTKIFQWMPWSRFLSQSTNSTFARGGFRVHERVVMDFHVVPRFATGWRRSDCVGGGDFSPSVAVGVLKKTWTCLRQVVFLNAEAAEYIAESADFFTNNLQLKIVWSVILCVLCEKTLRPPRLNYALCNSVSQTFNHPRPLLKQNSPPTR